MGPAQVVVTAAATAVAGVAGPDRLSDPAPLCPAGGVDPVHGLSERGLRYKDRATKLAFRAATGALDGAGLPADVPATGVVVSSNFGNVDTIAQCADTIAAHGYGATSPMLLPATASNVTAAALAIRHGLRGANVTLCDGPCSGLDAVHWARLLVAAGRVDRVLVVGVEPANAVVEHLVRTSGLAASRLLDGAAAVVVESADSARSRGVRPLASLGGYANRATHAEAVARVAPGHVGLWFAPDDPVAEPVAAVAGTRYLGDLLGRCSGALGVFQCAGGAAWLARGGPGPVLATAGADADGVTAALVLTAWSGAGGG